MGALAGAVTVVCFWLLLVPWDLSSVDATDRLRPEGQSSYYTPRMGVVLAGAALATAAVAFAHKEAGRACVVAGYLTTLVLFAWRTSAARVIGANLWALSFVLIVPVALAVFVLAFALGRAAANRG